MLARCRGRSFLLALVVAGLVVLLALLVLCVVVANRELAALGGRIAALEGRGSSSTTRLLGCVRPSAAAASPERRRRCKAGRHQGKNGANKAAAAANRPPLTYQRAWELLDPVRQPLERRRPATTGSKSCD